MLRLQKSDFRNEYSVLVCQYRQSLPFKLFPAWYITGNELI